MLREKDVSGRVELTVVHAAEPDPVDVEPQSRRTKPKTTALLTVDAPPDLIVDCAHHYLSPRVFAEVLELADLVDLEVDKNEKATDLGSTKEWTYGTSCTTPQGCRRGSTSHPELRYEIEANEIEIGKLKRGSNSGPRIDGL